MLSFEINWLIDSWKDWTILLSSDSMSWFRVEMVRLSNFCCASSSIIEDLSVTISLRLLSTMTIFLSGSWRERGQLCAAWCSLSLSNPVLSRSNLVYKDRIEFAADGKAVFRSWARIVSRSGLMGDSKASG